MDLNVISRLESHGKDLFRLGQKLAPIREGQQSDESGESEGGEEPQGEDKRHIPPECAGTQGENLVEAEQRMALKERKQQGLQAQQRYRMKRKASREKAHYEDLWAAFTRNMGKGFVLGSCSKLVLNLLYPILNLARGRRHGLTSKVLFEDVQGYGLFMGSLLALYNATMYETKKYAAEFAFIKHYRGMGAGFLAGIALLWMPRKKRWPIVLFTLVRALELQTKLLVKRKLIPSMEHGDVLLMSLASGSMLHNFVFDRAVLDPSYAGFLSKQSQAPPVIQDTFARMCLGQPLDLERINRWRATLQGVGPLKDPMIYDKILSRKILHPHLSFPGYVSRYFITAMKQALPVYLPVFSLPIILFYPGLLINKPVETVIRVLRGVLRSCLFLSMYVTVGFNSMEAMRDMGLKYSNVGSLAQLLIPFAGFISGFATLIEKKGRRIELALYVFSKAIEGRCNQALKYFTPMRNSDVLAFMYSFGVLAHAYTSHPSMFRPAYAGLMARFFDTDRRHKFYSMPRIMSKSLLSSTGDEKANLSQRVLSTIQRVQENHKQMFEDSDDPQESHKPVIEESFEPQDTEEAHM